MPMRIERELVDTAWGGGALLDAAIADFTAALAAHSATEGVPAPRADPLVEQIVRSGGAYEVVDVVEATPVEGRRRVAKSRIIERLHAAGKLVAASAALDADIYARERWYAPDRPSIYADDPDALALLAAISADAGEIMAP